MPPKVESKSEDKMAEKITLSVLTKFIKPYNGDRESLPAFLTNCDNAMSLASPDQQNVLCKYILSQLEGKAQVTCSLKTFESWNELKPFLKSAFGEKKDSTHLLLDMTSCRQFSNEDVTKYSLRIESILTRMQAESHYTCKDDKEIVGRIASNEELALKTFILGLHNPSISTVVRCRNPKSLDEAVQHAIEEEKLYNSRPKANPYCKSPKQCSLCHKTGHTSSECFSRNRKPQQFHNSYNVTTNQNSLSGPKKCHYCKNLGHTIQECRKLQYRNRQNSNTQGQANTPSPSSKSAHVKFCDVQNDNLNQ
ncbi:unnamed protein product [Plutella xylostella]|uniref:(diamondback moth) hypothetical protein n=1 Tax=Plutella xylostella TaxID=51655 RepID=A0A8S4DA39_PLUXY|nr:unnamed protein product [Plutella xylostella]